jgi:hypothetical protein
MFLRRTMAALLCLLILTIGGQAQEPLTEQSRVAQILVIAEENNIPGDQVAKAIADGTLPTDFAASITGKLRINAPDSATQGSPVQLTVSGLPETCTVLWRVSPVTSDQIWKSLYDEDGTPVYLFWSNKSDTYTFELIVAENGTTKPTIEIAKHVLEYSSTGPIVVPITIPEPDNRLKTVVRPLSMLRIDKNDLLNLTEFYHDFADVVRRDGAVVNSTIKDTAIFRETYTNAGKLMFQKTGMQGKYPALAPAIDKILASELGLDIGPLNHAEIAALLEAVAWAFSQGGQE